MPAAFGPQTSCGPGPELDLERVVSPKVLETQEIDQRTSPRCCASELSERRGDASLAIGARMQAIELRGRQFPYDVVRTGMTTWT